MKYEIKKLGNEFHQYKITREKDEMAFSTGATNQLCLIETRSASAIRKLVRHIKQLTEQIDLLRDANQRAARVIERQEALLDVFEDEFNQVHAQHDETRDILPRSVEENMD